MIYDSWRLARPAIVYVPVTQQPDTQKTLQAENTIYSVANQSASIAQNIAWTYAMSHIVMHAEYGVFFLLYGSASLELALDCCQVAEISYTVASAKSELKHTSISFYRQISRDAYVHDVSSRQEWHESHWTTDGIGSSRQKRRKRLYHRAEDPNPARASRLE